MLLTHVQQQPGVVAPERRRQPVDLDGASGDGERVIFKGAKVQL